MPFHKFFAALGFLGVATPCCFSQLHLTPEAGVFMLKANRYRALVSPRIGLGVDYLFSKEEKGWGIASGLYFYQKKNNSMDYFCMDQNNTIILFCNKPYPPLSKIIYGFIDTQRNYLQVPILAKYQWNFGKGYSLSVAAGPYVALGIAGKNEINSITYHVEENDFLFSDKKYDPYEFIGFKQFEVGFSSSVAFSANHLVVKANYETNLNERNLIRDNMISLSIGYSFSL